jgi:hypothetical protein
MKKIYTIFAVLTGVLLVGCVEISDRPYERKRLVEQYNPQCNQEATIAVYDEMGSFEVPGCISYSFPQVDEEVVAEDIPEETPQKAKFRRIKRTVKKTTKTIPQVEEELDVDAIEGEFPDVEKNKHVDEVVFEDLNSHILAYCRGTEEEIKVCVSRLEHTCYIRLEDIPRFAAKYDFLKTGTYPTRRWREGEYFPRW